MAKFGRDTIHVRCSVHALFQFRWKFAKESDQNDGSYIRQKIT